MQVIKLEVITLGNGSFKYQAIKDGKVIATRTSKRGYVAALIYEGTHTIKNGIGRYDLIDGALKGTPNADYLARLDFQEAPVNDTTVNDTTVNDTTVNDTTVNDTTVNDTPVNDTTVNDTTVNAKAAGPFVVKYCTDSYDAVAALLPGYQADRLRGTNLFGFLSGQGYELINLTSPLLVKDLPYGKKVLAVFHGGAMALIINDKTHQVEILGAAAELDTPILAYWVKKDDAYNLYTTDGAKFNNYPLNIDQAQKMAFLSKLNYNRKLTIL